MSLFDCRVYAAPNEMVICSWLVNWKEADGCGYGMFQGTVWALAYRDLKNYEKSFLSELESDTSWIKAWSINATPAC